MKENPWLYFLIAYCTFVKTWFFEPKIKKVLCCLSILTTVLTVFVIIAEKKKKKKPNWEYFLINLKMTNYHDREKFFFYWQNEYKKISKKFNLGQDGQLRLLRILNTQLTLTCSNSTIETLEKGVQR